MAPFYRGGMQSPQVPVYKPPSLSSLGLSGGSATLQNPPTSDEDDGLEPGKVVIDLTDPLGSASESFGSVVEFGSGIVGGVAGAVGSLGPDADTASIGQLFEDLGRIPGGIGDFQLPYLGNDPTREAAHLSDVPDLIGNVISAPGRFVEREVAEARVSNETFREAFDPRALLPGGGTLVNLERLAGKDDGRDLPPDLQLRLDNGESVEVITDELLARGAGFSSDPATNLAGEIILDPLNLIAPGASKAVHLSAAGRGMSKAGATVMDAVLGKTTSGVFHALGTKPYQGITSKLRGMDKAYAQSFEDAFSLGAAQMPRAVIGHYMADEASAIIRRGGGAPVGDVAGTVERRLDTVRALAPDDLERRTQELLFRVAPSFDGIPADALAAATARKLAAITGVSAEDAARILGNVDRQTAQTVHLAYYGRAGDDLAKARTSIAPFDPRAKRIDASRLTLVADDTLTTERAQQLLEPGADLVAALERYPVLANRFVGKAADDATIRAFVQRLIDQDALITTVRTPTTGANALPKALGAWRRKYAGDYDLGFAPESGWKVVTDADGVPVYADPFVHFVSASDPITMRNPLGRFMDSLFRGTTQTTIIAESRQRFVDDIVSRGLPIAPDQARAIHKAILEEAADRGVTPRSLVADSTKGASGRIGVIDAIFERFLTAGELAAVKSEVDPVYLVLRAFQGNLRSVGLTQYVTGGAKRAPGLGPMSAHVAERIYPSVRFGLNVLFQLQELLESKILNAMRGVTSRAIDPDVAKVYSELTDLPEFRYLTEAGYFLNIASGEAVARFVGVNTPIGRALGRFSDVAGRKAEARIAQVLTEHGEQFRTAVRRINPKAWRTMEDAYGSKDPRVIADRFLAERFAIGPREDIADAMATFDAARTLGTSAAEETVWQAFRSTFEQASRQAFKTHYFNPQRGWLERTINHPYLGVYPASYMYGKVLPEFARFLLRRPFGLDAPLVGMAGLVKTQQAFVSALAEDPEFRAYLEDHGDAAYLVMQLIPGDPTNLGAGAPAWARHISEDARAGRDITADAIGREMQDTAGYAFGAVRGPVTIAEGAADMADIAGDVFANLERAAALYDGQFPVSLDATPR